MVGTGDRVGTGGERRVTVLGSTGSVGRSTVDLLRRSPDRFTVECLVANRNVELLAAQARELRARRAVVADPACYAALRAALAGSGIETAAGAEATVAAAGDSAADWVMAAIVGAAGLAATLAAVRRGAVVAFANKETLVCAGDLVMSEVRRCGATLLPVDSEHNAIFQVFETGNRAAIEKIVLTASGGPFRTRGRAEMARVTPEEAVAHPNWSMGAKISVDSATMMNKGLEVIEAHHLFALGSSEIEVLVHPQSIVHGFVHYRDGSVLAQVGSPDMRTPIAHTLAWPGRIEAPVAALDLAAIGQLTFEAPDPGRFPALRLARAALEAGGGAATALNAANEVAVHAFLERRIGFLDIVDVVEHVLDSLGGRPIGSLAEVEALDREARDLAERRAATLGVALMTV